MPALKTDDGIIWDSLAILEYLAEQHPSARLWPADREARAAARSVSAEMHSGFVDLRNDMPMDLLSRLPAPPITEALRGDIERIVAIWMEARHRARGDGPFLFGDFCTGVVEADQIEGGQVVSRDSLGVIVPELSSFGVDGLGRVYLTSTAGPVYRLDPA